MIRLQTCIQSNILYYTTIPCCLFIIILISTCISFHIYTSNEFIQEKIIIYFIIITIILLFVLFLENTTALGPNAFCKEMERHYPPPKPVKRGSEHGSTSNSQPNINREPTSRLRDFDLNKKPREE